MATNNLGDLGRRNQRKLGVIGCLTVLASIGCVVPLFGAAPPAPDMKKSDPMKLLRELPSGTVYDLTFTVPETGETVQKKGEFGLFPQLVFKCFSTTGKGAITAVVRLPETGDKFTLRTKGLAEDLYLVHYLSLQESFAKWHKKVRADVKDSPDVVVGLRKPSKGETEIDRVPRYLLSAVAAAAVKYEEKRPELSLRVRLEESRLYFPPAGEASWRVTRNGDRLFVRTGCVDKMYAATFEIEFRNVGGEGEWEYVRLRGEEHWKGE